MSLMLEDFAKARNWTNDGVPTPEKLKDLGIE
jgi:aldehyde:ferredoxin oxidoreductase